MDHRIFINHRTGDSHSYAALLYTGLTHEFGERNVFLDCESIPAGADFVAELVRRVRSAQVVLAVIGPRWLAIDESTGRRRIDDPGDWIRRELVEAFTHGVRVVPVLTDAAALPADAELPRDIAALSGRQARRLRCKEPAADLARLISDLADLDPTLAEVLARDRHSWAPSVNNSVVGDIHGKVVQVGSVAGDVRL